MLAVSDANYYLPYREPDVIGGAWKVQRRDSDEVIITRNLSYTINAHVLGDDVKRLTFEYRGDSVKAAPRTLRLVGAAVVSGFTAKLAGIQRPKTLVKLNQSPEGIDWNVIGPRVTERVFGKR